MPVQIGDLYRVRRTLSEEERAEALKVAQQILDWASGEVPTGAKKLLWWTRDGLPASVSTPSAFALNIFREAKLIVELFHHVYIGPITDSRIDLVVIFDDCVGRRIHYSKSETYYETVYITSPDGTDLSMQEARIRMRIPDKAEEHSEPRAVFLTELLLNLREGKLRKGM